MWSSYLATSNNRRVEIFVHDTGLRDGNDLFFDSCMSESQWNSQLTPTKQIVALHKERYNACTEDAHPLFVLNADDTVSLELDGPKMMTQTKENCTYHFGGIHIHAADAMDGFTLIKDSPETESTSSISVTLWAKPNGSQFDAFDVYRIQCTLHTSQLVRGIPETAAAFALRAQHFVHGTICRDQQTQDELSQYRTKYVVKSDPSTPNRRFRTFNALCISYAIDTGDNSLLTTSIGNALLNAYALPDDSVRANPSLWIKHVAEQANTPIYDQFDTTGVVDLIDMSLGEWVRNQWSQTTTGFKAIVRKLTPSPKTIAAFKRAHTTIGKLSKTAANSKTVSAIIEAVNTKPDDAKYLHLFADAILTDSGFNETNVGALIIDNANDVEDALRETITKLRDLPVGDIIEWGKELKLLIGNEDLKDGVYQLAKGARNAVRYFKPTAESQ